MDKFSNERVLAYKKATELSEEELRMVSGGSNSVTHQQTLKATDGINSADVKYDQTIDW